MVVQLESLPEKVSFNSTSNNLACSPSASSKVNEEYEQDVRSQESQESSKQGSLTTLIDEGNDFELSEKVSWMAGVGNIYNREFRESNVQSTRINRRKTGRGLAMNYHKTACIGTSSVSVKPHRSQHNPNSRRSALHRHCDFWATDQDGMIYPWDIFIGFHRLGFHMSLCLWAAVTMPVCSSYSTQASWLPHPLFAINLNNISSSRHGSTTSTYDMDSELDMRRFNAIFQKYAEGKDYLTWRTMYNIWRGQCCANDFFGWFAGALEWIAMYILLWPHDGRIKKDDILGVYDGSIFRQIANARA